MDEWYGQVAPREKLLKYGAAVLTDAELLAIFCVRVFLGCM